MTLALAKIPFEFRWVDLDVPEGQRGDDVRAACRFGEVPALLHGERAFVQSNAILLHLAQNFGCLSGDAADCLLEIREWLFWEANRVGLSLANLRHLVEFERSSETEVVQWLRRRLDQDLDVLESHLGPRQFLVGKRVTIADVSCSAYLLFAKEACVSLERWPAVSLWLQRISSSPGWDHPEVLMPPGC